MKKGFSLMRLFAFVMTVLSVTVAHASSDGFYWFKTEAVAYAPGNGQVYVGKSDSTPVYQDTCRVETHSSLNAFGFYYWAKPSEEFNFVGWSEDMENLLSVENPFYTAFETTTEATKTEDEPNYPDEPKRLYACFGYIRVEPAKGHEDLGSVSIYPLCNEARETVTLSAVAADGSEFDYWENSAGERFYEADLEFVVTDPDIYVAHFKNPGMFTLHFEGDELIAFSHRGSTDLGSEAGIDAYYFNNRMLIDNKLLLTNVNRLAYNVNEDRGYLMKAEAPGDYLMIFSGANGAKMYNDLLMINDEDTEEGEVTEGEGSGEGTEEGKEEEEKEPFINKGANDFNILIPTLDQEIWIDALPDSCNYYTFDGKQFNLVVVKEGESYLFPENSAFLQVPKYMNTGDVITLAKGHGEMIYNEDNAWDFYYEYYLDEPEEDAVIAAPVVRRNTKDIFDLQGRRIAAPRRGVNIIGGKKVVL